MDFKRLKLFSENRNSYDKITPQILFQHLDKYPRRHVNTDCCDHWNLHDDYKIELEYFLENEKLCTRHEAVQGMWRRPSY